MAPERLDRFSQTVGMASRRHSVTSLLGAAALGMAALRQAGQPTAALTRKQCACKVKGARVRGLLEGICIMSGEANSSQEKRDECVTDAAKCGDLATACKSADACKSAFF